jgi:hypothetical protein
MPLLLLPWNPPYLNVRVADGHNTIVPAAAMCLVFFAAGGGLGSPFAPMKEGRAEPLRAL